MHVDPLFFLLVQDDTKSVDQGDIASGGHTKGDSEKNISKSKDDNTTNSQTEQVARKRKLESDSGAGDTREDLHTGHGAACSIDTGQTRSVTKVHVYITTCIYNKLDRS